MLSPGRGNEYRWHESEHDRSCEIFGDGVIHIFSHSMSAASPAAELEPVNAHRFYLYQLTGLDLTKDSDKAKCREYLFDRGYGSDPKAFAKKQKRFAKTNDTINTPKDDNDTIRKQLTEAVQRKIDEFLTTETDKKRVCFVNASVGTGKSYIQLKTIAETQGTGCINIVGNTEQRKQTHDTAVGLFGSEDWCFEWQGRFTGFDLVEDGSLEDRQQNASLFGIGVMCPVADWHQRLVKKGIKSSEACNMCPLRQTCIEKGHLSQWNEVKNKRCISIALPDALDEDFADFMRILQESMETEKQVFLIRDDYNLSDLLEHISISVDEVRSAAENKREVWNIDTETLNDEAFEDVSFVRYAQAFLERLVEILTGEAEQVFKKVKEVVEDCISAGTAEAITTGLGVVVHSGEVKNAADALQDGMKPKNIGRVWHGGTNLFRQLHRWTSEHQADTVLYDVDYGALQFRLKTKLTGIDNLFLLSGTTPPHLAKRLLPAEKCEFHEINMPQPTLAEKVTILQYTQAKLTSESVFEVGEDEQAIGIKQGASDLIFKICDLVEKEKQIRRSEDRPSKAVWISLSEFCTDRDGNPLNPAIHATPEAEAIRQTFDVILHYRTAEGRNVDGIGVNVLFGYPKVRHEDVRTMTAVVFQKLIPEDYTEATEVKERTRKGIRLTERSYIDDDAESVRIGEAEGLGNQGVGRSRPYTWADTTTLIFSKMVLDVSREATHFEKSDFTGSDTLADIAVSIKQREKAIKSGDVQAVMQATGGSKRTAERKTKDTRSAKREEEMLHVFELQQQGFSQRRIEKETGFSRRKITKLLDEYEAVQKRQSH